MAKPLQVVETAHRDMIHDAQLDYYSRRLATCSSDRTIKIYDVYDGGNQLTGEITGHDGPIWQVAWAHPRFGTLLASCGYDRRIIIHREEPSNYNQPAQWTQIYSFDGHTSSVNSVAWAPHEYGLLLAAASSDGSVSWHRHIEGNTWASDSFRFSTIGCNAVSWAPFNAPGSTEGEGHALQLVTGSCDGVARVWRKTPDQQNFECVQELKGHTDWVRDVAWAPSAAVPTNMIATASEDKTVLIWRQGADGTWAAPVKLPRDFGSPVWRVSWSITGNVLAVSTGEQDVSLWKESVDNQWVQLSSLDENQGGETKAPTDAASAEVKGN